jgi:hypothetical protein
VAIARVRKKAEDVSIYFDLLILGATLYSHLADPFALSDRYPPTWDFQHLETLTWPPEPLPPRLAIDLQPILKGPDPAFMLGATQAIVDGGRLLIRSSDPANTLLRSLWQLLPVSTQHTVTMATLTFNVQPSFQVAAVPQVPTEGIEGFLTEEQCRDYPEGRYERDLEWAINTGNQRDLNQLLFRRSSAETLRLAIFILIAVTLLAIVMSVVTKM